MVVFFKSAMIEKISQTIKENIQNFPSDDSLIFNNRIIKIDKSNFRPLISTAENKTITFVDGGQAEILSAGNFCLSFIRIFAQAFQGNKKINSDKNEFYVLTTAIWNEGDIFYGSTVFPLTEKLIDETDLLISSNDSTIKNGIERAPIAKVASMARRFAELELAFRIQADYIVLDGTLEPSYKNEEKYLEKLSKNTSAIAKISSLFTASGNSPVVLLNKIGLPGCWSYFVDDKTSFMKLHPQARHVFRFEGNRAALPFLVENSSDAVFVGYPYGLIYADKMARVSNAERDSLRMNFLLRKENKEILHYLNSTNAHEILDEMG